MRFDPVLGLSMPELGWVPAPRYLLRRDRILAGIRPGQSGRALEIGCGAGALIKDLRLRGYRCVAIETSPAAAAIARTVHQDDPGVTILDRGEDDWSDRFDFILACEVLEHIEDDHGILADWVKWLKPGGRFLISAPGRPEKWDATDVWAGHFRRYTRESIGALCDSAGLQVESIESYGYPLINLIAPIRAMSKGSALRRQSSRSHQEEATASSGIDRRLETRLFRFLDNPIGRSVIRYGSRWQRNHLQGDRGLALLAWATKP